MRVELGAMGQVIHRSRLKTANLQTSSGNEVILTTKESYFVGTNTTPQHVEEALHQGIIRADERVLGIFDGIFFDEAGSRVGGLALNDFLVITDRRLTTWARDQFKDYVDFFPLSHAFVTAKKIKTLCTAPLVWNWLCLMGRKTVFQLKN